MKIPACRAALLVAITVGLFCPGTGCKKKSGTEAAVEQSGGATSAGTPSGALPGAQQAMAAIEKKDYQGAVAILAATQQSLSSPQQKVQFATLVDEVKIALLEAAPNNPKASQALSALRALTGGR